MSVRLSGMSSFYLFQRSLQIRNSDIFRTSEQLSTQKRINRPSDDPAGHKSAQNLKTTVGRLDQYARNIDEATHQMTATESALDGVKEILVRLKEISIAGNNGTLTQANRNILADEVHQKVLELEGLANSQYSGQYIFSGLKTDTKPYTLNVAFPTTPSAAYAGDTNQRTVQIGDNQTMTVQVRGDQAFQGDGTASTVDLFAVIGGLENTLRTTIDPTAVSGDPHNPTVISDAMGDAIGDLEKGFNQILSQITSLGGKMARLDSTKENYSAQTLTFKTFISDIEDKDMAELTMEFQRAQLALQATLGATGAVMNLPSLMEFVGK